MKKLTCVLLLLLTSLAHAQPAPLGNPLFPAPFPVQNDTTTGTSLFKLADLTNAGRAIISNGANAAGAIGVVTGNAGTVGTAYITYAGTVPLYMDGASTVGDCVIRSTTSGEGHDTGLACSAAPVLGETVGVVKTVSGGSGQLSEVILKGAFSSAATQAQLFTVNAQVASYPVVSSDFTYCKTISVNATGSSTITLLASAPASGQCVDIINYAAFPVTVSPNGLTINGSSSSIILAAGTPSLPLGLHVVSNGTNYIAQTWGTGTQTIASGSQALGTAAIAANSCNVSGGTSEIDIVATNVLSTDAVAWTPNANISGATGYSYTSTDGLKIYVWPAAGYVKTIVCNGTATSITPGAVTLNYRVTR